MSERVNSNEIGNGNEIENGNQDANRFPDTVWILPLMILGAMFGSLVGAGISHALGQPTPFGLALIGIIVGMFFVAAVGLLVIRNVQSG